MNKFMDCKQTYVQTMVERSLKTQQKINEAVKADLNKQEELFQHRKLKRVKSSKYLWSYYIYLHFVLFLLIDGGHKGFN